MRDVNEHTTHPGTTQDQDPDHPPEPGRRRDDPTPADGGGVNPGPPQRGGGEPQAGSRGAADPRGKT